MGVPPCSKDAIISGVRPCLEREFTSAPRAISSLALSGSRAAHSKAVASKSLRAFTSAPASISSLRASTLPKAAACINGVAPRPSRTSRLAGVRCPFRNASSPLRTARNSSALSSVAATGNTKPHQTARTNHVLRIQIPPGCAIPSYSASKHVPWERIRPKLFYPGWATIPAVPRPPCPSA